jgi:hypothetical protein
MLARLIFLALSGAGMVANAAEADRRQVFRPCPASSPAVAEARRDLESLGKRIDWRWIDKDKMHGAGSFRVGVDPGHTYAAHLLAALESTFEAGQPTESLPVGEHWYPPAP